MTKKRSLWLINEHFESVFNAVYASEIVFQRFPKLNSLQNELVYITY